MYRLLIADGDGGARAALRSLLPWRAYGFETVAEADSYAAAVDRALDIRPDAALVALRLGERSGLELIRRLTEAGLGTAFCVLADSAEAGDMLRAMRAGARDYLLTPADPEEVRAFLERVLPGCTGGAPDASLGADEILGTDPARFSALTRKMLLLAGSDMPAAPVTLTAIAQSLHMNGKYLGRVFLRDTGMRFSRYVTACRMERARRLIAGTSEKISVIARTVGYSQPNRFYVHFKSYFGVSPGQLRAFAPSAEGDGGEDLVREVAF